jgi:hypothetical protein
MLIFLKYVESIELCVRDAEGGIQQLFYVAVQHLDDATRCSRSKLIDYVTANEFGSFLDVLQPVLQPTLFEIAVYSTSPEDTVETNWMVLGKLLRLTSIDMQCNEWERKLI